MVDQASQMIQEIKQIKAQYVAEVGKGRRARLIRYCGARLSPVKENNFLLS